MNANNSIEVRNLTKTFKFYYDKGNTLKERALSKARNKYEVHQVLKGISFDVAKGEAVGLVGNNGCGKSTTLKLLTRIMYPDSGSIEISGRVSSLLELGAGFHPDLSGRENIFINASILGLERKEIEQRLDDIIEFSELEEYIDNPVRTYSSGMYMRLAFSVAINVNADILLIDEILAVGDVNFQTKCFNKLMEIKGKGTTIVLVSHSTSQIERICDRSIWIHDGRIRESGEPHNVHRLYLNYMHDQKNEIAEDEKRDSEAEDIIDGSQNESTDPVIIKNVKILNKENKRTKVFRIMDDVCLEIQALAQKRLEKYYIEINVVRADGLFCYGCSTVSDGIEMEEWIGERQLHIVFERVNLIQGKYHCDIHVANEDGSTIFFGGNIAEFEIENDQLERGLVYIEHKWMRD